jgi:hypothetical protein
MFILGGRNLLHRLEVAERELAQLWSSRRIEVLETEVAELRDRIELGNAQALTEAAALTSIDSEAVVELGRDLELANAALRSLESFVTKLVEVQFKALATLQEEDGQTESGT